MRELIRLIATLTIWVVFATVMGVSLTSSTGPVGRMDGGQVIGLVAVMAAASVVSTIAIWLSGTRADLARRDATHVARGKAKRLEHDRVGRLIEALDDDEIYDLEALLLARHDDSGQKQ